MAKKVNLFAGDFKNIDKSADEKMIALLKQETSEKQSVTQAVTKPSTTRQQKTLTLKDQENVDDQSKEISDAPKPKASNKNEKKIKPTKPKIEEWGKPVALFNTRIPEKMAELLDDLVYKQKKSGSPVTKQSLAHEAFSDLLMKHKLL